MKNRNQESGVRSQNEGVTSRASGVRMFFLLTSVFCLLSPVFAQGPATTTVQDTVYKSDGSLASGTVVITWPAFVSGDGKPVVGGTKTVPLSGGNLAVTLTPNAGGTPSGTSYRIRYYESAGRFFEETWVVPSSNPLSSPGQPTVTNVGTPGTTTYYYWVSATNAEGETQLGPSQVTTTSNATLNTNNYNQVDWDAVTGATGYKVYRTPTATAPSGTGSYLVGETATTTINDQSNSLQQATIPALNSTDPRTLSEVRVTAAPSPTVSLAAAQVSGTAIVSNPDKTQSIGAPAKSGVIPLQLKGQPQAAANVFEVYNSQPSPALQGWFDKDGALAVRPGVHGGPDTTSYSGYMQSWLIGTEPNLFGTLNNAGSYNGLTGAIQKNFSDWGYGVLGLAENLHSTTGLAEGVTNMGVVGWGHMGGPGSMWQVGGVAGQAFVDAGTVERLTSLFAWRNYGTGGTVNNNYGLLVDNQAGVGTNNYGINILNQTGAANNWAIKTGTGKVQFGDDVIADKNLYAKAISQVRFADQFAGADAGAKIVAAIADLPSTGGTVDARGLEGAQSISGDICSGVTKPVTLLLGAATYTVSANVTCASNVAVIGTMGTVLSPDSGITITLNGPRYFPDDASFAGAGLVESLVSPGTLEQFNLTNDLTDNRKRAISIQARTTSTTGTINTGGISVDIYTPPDNGGDVSGLWVRQTGGGNALSIYNMGAQRPGGFTNYPSNGYAIEAGSDYGKTALWGRTFDGTDAGGTAASGTALLLTLEGTDDYGTPTDRGLFIRPSQDVALTRSAISLVDSGTTQENFYVKLDGTGFFRGNVGIGGSPDATPLSVYGPARSVASNPRFFLESTDANTSKRILDVSGTGASAVWRFFKESKGSDTTLTYGVITSAGNWGLGINPALTKLDVNGAIRSTLTTVAYSATPAFDASLGNSFRIVLAGNVTNCTISNPAAGQVITLIIKQSAGGSNTFACAALLGLMTISATADKRNVQSFIYDGTDAVWLALSSGVTGM